MGRDGDGKPSASYFTFGCMTNISCLSEIVTIWWEGGSGVKIELVSCKRVILSLHAALIGNTM